MEPQDPRLGTLVDGRYRLLRLLGAGGAGTVYLARHEEMDRLVAVKLLHGELPAHSSAFVRFRREARAAGSLKHPGIVTIHDFGRTPAGEAFLVMELCEGASLSERLGREGPLPPRESLRVLGEVAAAVDAAHAAGMVHRDLKPANILFADGRVRVADFGLARVFDDQDGQLTGAHAIGSPPYMSPEQCQGLPATSASDVYSLGVIAFELLSGRLPFTGGNVQAILVAHVAEEPPSPSEWLPDFPAAGETVLRTALAKEPFARWGSAGAFHAALVQALDGGESLSRTISELRAPAAGRSGGTGAARGATGARDRSGAPPSPPIGREAELERLLALAGEAADGAGHLVTVAGETGSGKSTLVAAFLARVRARWPGSWVALGRASERFAAAEPYAPFLDALGELLRGPARPRLAGALASIAPTWAAHLPGLAAGGGAREELLEGRRSRDRMPREFAALVDELAARQPLVLALEDLHWADAASIDLLAWVAPRLEQASILLVGTYRPAEVEIERHPLRGLLGTLARGGLPWTEIVPAAFDRSEVAAFLARELAQPPPDDLVEFVYRRSDGNPLFLVNVLNHLFQSGAIERRGSDVVFARPLSSVERTLPEGIVAVIRQKVERLGEDDRRLLEAASVEGEAFSAALVARLVEQDEAEVEERLRELGQRHRLIEPAGELEFPDGAASSRFRYVHSLYQNAFYEALAPKRRERLHARAGEELERLHAARPQGVLVPMAIHFEKGREFQRAIDKTLAAADLAAWRNPKDARPHLEKAIELAARLPESSSRRLRAGLLVRLARHDAESAEFTGDTALYDRAEEAVSEALLLEPGSLDARTTLGLVHLERGENERAFADFARVLERDAGQAPAWDGLSYLLKNTGFWRPALAAQQRAAARDPGYAHSIRRLSVLIYLDRSDEAEAEAEALVERRPFFAHYNYWRGIAAWYAGDRRRARQWIEQGHSLDPGDPIAQGVLAFALAAEGETGRARELLAAAEPGAAADGTFTYWIAKVHALLGEGAEAVRWIRRAAGLGYWDAPWMRKDPAIRSLDAEPDLPEVLAEIDARRAALERFVRSNARPDLLAALEL